MDNQQLNTSLLKYAYSNGAHFRHLINEFKKSIEDEKLEKEFVLYILDLIDVNAQHMTTSIFLKEFDELIKHVEEHGDDVQKDIIKEIKHINVHAQQTIEKLLNTPKE